MLTVAGLAALTNTPPFHTIVLPALIAVNVALVFVQFKLLLMIAVKGGAVVFCDTATTDDELQPLIGSVTVNV